MKSNSLKMYEAPTSEIIILHNERPIADDSQIAGGGTEGQGGEREGAPAFPRF